MKDTKKTKVPLPGSKPKSKPQNTPSKPQLSQEIIDGDSDDDSPSESSAQPKNVEKPKPTIGIHKNSVLISKSKSSKKDAGSSKAASNSKPAPKKPAPKQIVTEEQVADLSSSDISDDNAPTRDIQTKLPGNKRRKDASSDSDSSEESDSDEEMANAPQPTRKPAQPPPQRQPESHAVAFQPTKAYAPPRGFNPVPLNARTVSTSTALFENLQGKQIWHITAPAGVLLESLSGLDMDKAMKGEVVVSYKGTDYGFSQTEQSEDGARKVFIPGQENVAPVSTRISQTLRLRSVVKLPQLTSKQADQNTGSEAAASITRSTIRAPRPPVTGLKMRFRPIGFGGDEPGILGDSDDEAAAPTETAVLGMPEELNLPSRKPKRKHADTNGDEELEAPPKKTKKHRDPEEVRRKEEKKARKEKKRAETAAKS